MEGYQESGRRGVITERIKKCGCKVVIVGDSGSIEADLKQSESCEKCRLQPDFFSKLAAKVKEQEKEDFDKRAERGEAEREIE